MKLHSRDVKMPWNLCSALIPLAFLFIPSFLLAQKSTLPKKSSVIQKIPATAVNEGAKSTEPATAEYAASVLDLRTFPVMADAKASEIRTLGMLMYEAKGTPKVAMTFQRDQLIKRGFTELPGGYSDPNTESAQFSKAGFHVLASASLLTGQPDRNGWSSVSVINEGNVPLNKLPVPPKSIPFHPTVMRGSFTTDAKPAETAEACRKLLLAAKWEPFGQAVTDSTNPDSHMQSFKRNAIKLLAWVSRTPAEGGKTLIRYSTELLSVDLPVPTWVPNPSYTDFQKTLRFDVPNDKTPQIIEFYQQKLLVAGWKATTDRPIVEEKEKSQFLVFRNASQELLALDLKQFNDIVRVSLKHQSAAEVATEEKQYQAKIQRDKEEMALRSKTIRIVVPLSSSAKNLEKIADNLFEFSVPNGAGATVLKDYQDQFKKNGWTEVEDIDLGKNAGTLNLKKEEIELGFTYIDTGVLPVTIRVSAPKNVFLEPQLLEVKSPAPPGKSKKKGTVPGIPELPPGVKLPEDVNEIIKRALEQNSTSPPTSSTPPRGAPKR